MVWARRLAVVLPSVVAAVEGVLLYALLRAHGRALLVQEELSERLSQVEATLQELTTTRGAAAQPSPREPSVGTVWGGASPSSTHRPTAGAPRAPPQMGA